MLHALNLEDAGHGLIKVSVPQWTQLQTRLNGLANALASQAAPLSVVEFRKHSLKINQADASRLGGQQVNDVADAITKPMQHAERQPGHQTQQRFDDKRFDSIDGKYPL